MSLVSLASQDGQAYQEQALQATQASLELLESVDGAAHQVSVDGAEHRVLQAHQVGLVLQA